jgi:hypothetical protein
MIKNFENWNINEFEKDPEPTHVLVKEIPRDTPKGPIAGSSRYKIGMLAHVKDGFGKKTNHPPDHESHSYDNEISIPDPDSTEYTKRTWRFYLSDADLEKYFKPYTETMKASRKFGLQEKSH